MEATNPHRHPAQGREGRYLQRVFYTRRFSSLPTEFWSILLIHLRDGRHLKYMASPFPTSGRKLTAVLGQWCATRNSIQKRRPSNRSDILEKMGSLQTTIVCSRLDLDAGNLRGLETFLRFLKLSFRVCVGKHVASASVSNNPGLSSQFLAWLTLKHSFGLPLRRSWRHSTSPRPRTLTGRTLKSTTSILTQASWCPSCSLSQRKTLTLFMAGKRNLSSARYFPGLEQVEH